LAEWTGRWSEVGKRRETLSWAIVEGTSVVGVAMSWVAETGQGRAGEAGGCVACLLIAVMMSSMGSKKWPLSSWSKTAKRRVSM